VLLQSRPRRFHGTTELGAVLRAHVFEFDIGLRCVGKRLQGCKRTTFASAAKRHGAARTHGSHKRTQRSTTSILQQRWRPSSWLANQQCNARHLHAIFDDIRCETAIAQVLRRRCDDGLLKLTQGLGIVANASQRQHYIVDKWCSIGWQ
jgi:hypothetical protein